MLEPSKRFSIEQIKNHHWMQMGEGRPKSTPPSPLIGYNAKVGEFNEQILRLMQSLGINQQKTMEVRQHHPPKMFEIMLTLKALITTAADDISCDTYQNFRKK